MNAAGFWNRVAFAGPDDCWEWQGFRNERGYGRITNTNDPTWPRSLRAHRYAFALHTGQHPGELDVLHSCDNPPCCNPAHLRLGTPADNSRDRVERGRSRNIPKGSANKNAKLTEDAVREIRRRCRVERRGERTRIAREYGVSKTTLAQMLRGETWAHVQ